MRLTGYVANFISIYSFVILAYIVMSWFASEVSGPLGGIYRGLASICEPFLGIFRRLLPPVMVGSAGIDLSPIIALFVLRLLGGYIGGL